MWYTGADQDWADVQLTRDVDVPAGADAKFWMWNNYVIEEDWDFGFVEVSTDGGTTWTEQKVYDEAGDRGHHARRLRRPERPHARLRRQEVRPHRQHRRLAARLRRPGAVRRARPSSVRLRYATDAAFQERGWFADDFSVTGGGTTVWSDDVEGGDNGWTADGRHLHRHHRRRLAHRHRHVQVNAQYYLAEWRNFDGFDKGLKYAYDTDLLRDGAWKVEKITYNAPGMLVWYRDTTLRQRQPRHGQRRRRCRATARRAACSSSTRTSTRCGAPARRPRSTRRSLNNLPSRAAVVERGVRPAAKTYPFTECIDAAAEPFSEYCTTFKAQEPVTDVHRRQGLVPGHRDPRRRGPVLPRQRRARCRPVARQRAVHHPGRRRGRQPAHRVLRRAGHARHDARHRQPG